MTERWGTIFEISAKKATRHKAPQLTFGRTICGQAFGRYWAMHHDKPLEVRCKKCYPITRKAKPWPTSSKKK